MNKIHSRTKASPNQQQRRFTAHFPPARIKMQPRCTNASSACADRKYTEWFERTEPQSVWRSVEKWNFFQLQQVLDSRPAWMDVALNPSSASVLRKIIIGPGRISQGQKIEVIILILWRRPQEPRHKKLNDSKKTNLSCWRLMKIPKVVL